ncbi:MAG: alcohol dehydrogenase catalytic domain-containing protein [Planctomycetaceae bacterium]
MKAVCFEAVERIGIREMSTPALLQPGDAIVRVELAGLCGSDLHPFFGREAGLDVGTVMGHEFVGRIDAVGAGVTSLTDGDRVCAPFTTNCGVCHFCMQGLTSRCSRGELFGWRSAGEGLHGGQSQYVRVPMADATLMKIPEGMDNDTALLLGDNLSTGYFCADMANVRPNAVFAVIGCGTVGLLALAWAKRLGAGDIIAIDPVESRRKVAESLGGIACTPEEASKVVMERTSGRGADGVMELVGLPDAQKLAFEIISPGGTMSVIGCHCTPNFAFSPVDAYDKNLTYRTGRCPARHYMSALVEDLVKNPMDLSWCITHRFNIDDSEAAYQTFAYRKDGCMKAALIM